MGVLIWSMHISKAVIFPTMKKLTLATLLIFSCATAWAADFEKGWVTYNNDADNRIRLYLLDAAQGSAQAQHNLAWSYHKGNGTPKNIKQAVRWYRKAAQQGFADSQYNLGLIYAKGTEVQKDELAAVRLLRSAAEKRQAGAINQLGYMYAQGNGVQKDLIKAVALYRQAAILGDDWGQANLGYAYFNGRGLVVNKIYAYVWSDIGARNGNATGAKNRDLFMQSMTDSQISIAKKLSKKCIRKGYVDCL